MVFDPMLGGVVLFGGVNMSSSVGAPLGDLWLYRGNSWTRVATPSAPLGRYEAALTYDPTLPGLVLFGGFFIGGEPLSDTWTFVGDNWTELPVGTGGGVPPLFGAAVVFDPDLNCIVLTGGASVGAFPVDGSFFLNGSAWSPLVTRGSPGYHIEALSAYDPIDDEWVVAGGLGNYSTTDALRASLTIRSVSLSPPNETGVPIRFIPDVVGNDPSATYSWVWGDGSASNGSSPNGTHSYSLAGVYTVQLNVWDGPSDSANWSGVVRIATALSLVVTSEAPGVDAGVPVTFLANGHAGLPPIRFVWTMPGGAIVQGARVVLTLPNPGPARISVSATDSVGATVTVDRNLTVAPPPTPLLNGTVLADAGVPRPMNGTMMGGTAPWSYRWSFPDGSTIGGPLATYTFPAPSSDLVRLQVWDTGNFSMVQTIPVAVAAPPSVRILGPASVRPDTTGEWSAVIQGGSGPFRVAWRTTDGASATGTVFSAALPGGTETVSVTITDAAGGLAEANLTVHSDSGPGNVVQGIAGPVVLVGALLTIAAVVSAGLLHRRRHRTRTGGRPYRTAAEWPAGVEVEVERPIGPSTPEKSAAPREADSPSEAESASSEEDRYDG